MHPHPPLARIPKPRFVTAISLLIVLFSTFSSATGQSSAPPAPLPSQLATAKKVFIANVPGYNLPDSVGGSVRVYNEFYAAMKTWGRYELVSAPADADLIFEVSFASQILGVIYGTSTSSAGFQVVIVDPKTHVTLWWIQQDIENAIREKTLPKNLSTNMSSLLVKIKQLVEPPVGANAPSKP